MAHPYFHAKSAARHFGGTPEDYLAIENWFDQTKRHVAEPTHRLVLHNSWGIFFAERFFGETFVRPSDGRVVPLRPVAELHVREDYGGWIPSLAQCFDQLPAMPLATSDDALEHCTRSAARFGGVPDDYIELHHAMNAARSVLADSRHQVPLHNAFGIDLLVGLFGEWQRRDSDDAPYPVRAVLEEHVFFDLGTIPSLAEALDPVQVEEWMWKRAQKLSFADMRAARPIKKTTQEVQV